MAYKFATGSVRRGDIYNEDDTQGNTYLDWNEDAVGVVAGGTTVFVVSGSTALVGIGTSAPDYTLDVAGNIGVDEYIYHNGDADTWIRFSDDDITIKAGGKAFLTLEEKGTAPHELIINDGGNNIDFVVKGNSNNPGMKFDGSLNRLGINGVGSPSWALDVDGDIGLAEYIYHKDDDDTYIQFSDDEIVLFAGGRGFLKCQENDSTDKLMINYGGLDVDLQVKGANEANLIRTDAANDLVGIGTSDPTARLTVSGSEFDGLAIAVADDHTNYFEISGSEHGSVTSFGVSAVKAATDAPDASCFISGTVGGKGDYGVTVISGDLQVSGNIYNTLGDGATTIFSPYLAQQILDPSSYALFSITNSSTTLYKVDWDTGDTSCTDPHVTFTAPPSGKVLVDVHVYIDDTSTGGAGPYVYLALSTSTAASISSTDGSIVGGEKIIWYPDEADDGVRTLTFYATGLTAGTSYTWNLFSRRWNDGDSNRIICGGQYPAMIMQVRPIGDNADIYSS
jgi:hypothetical protein